MSVLAMIPDINSDLYFEVECLLEDALSSAARRCECQTVEKLLRKGAKNIDRAMSSAIRSRSSSPLFREKMIQFLLSKGASNWSEYFFDAAEVGDMETMLFFHNIGSACDYDRATRAASEHGHDKVVNEIQKLRFK